MRLAALASAVGLLLGVTTVASADELSPDSPTVTLAPAAFTTVNITLVATDDPANFDNNFPGGTCNLREQSMGPAHFVDAGVTSSNTGVATVSPSSLTFTACGQTFPITITAVNCGTATVTIARTDSRSAGGVNAVFSDGTIAVTVSGNCDGEPPITVCAQPAAPAWAAAILQANGVKAKQGQNLISQVAKQMLPGASFPDYRAGHNPATEQVNKVVQSSYADAVYAYLLTLKSPLPVGPAGSARPGWACVTENPSA